MTSRVGGIGRTRMLIAAAEAVAGEGHAIVFVHTCGAEAHYDAGERDFRDLADRMQAPLFVTRNTRTVAEAWRATRPDVCISLNWPSLIPREVRDIAPHGVLNAHAGDLPRYRGNACPNWALLNFETTVGLTIHRMSDELDAGPYLFKTFLDIDETTYVGDIYTWIAARVPAAFVAALTRIATPGFIEQDPAIRPLRTYPRRPEDARLDWTAARRDILALIRASGRPFDGAFTTFDGGNERVRILRARTFDPPFDYLAVPGQICLSRDGNPVIAAGDGMVEIEECLSGDRDDAATRKWLLRSLRGRLI